MGEPSSDPEARVADGSLWKELCATLEASRTKLRDESFPDTPADRAEYLRYLLRFFASGIATCVEHADPDHPEFTRMMDLNRRWGLDSPDHLYLFATIRGDAEYRIVGDPGSANLLDIQVNTGHFALGAIGAMKTIGSRSGDELARNAHGEIELRLGGAKRAGDWLPLTPEARFVQVRQVFADWERERPAELIIERVGGAVLRPRLDTRQIDERIALLQSWLERGGALWRDMSKLMLALPPNTLRIPPLDQSAAHGGLRGQAYGMGNFSCGPDEAVILEFRPPRCRHWSVSLANWWWEAIDFTARQSSLNQAQAQLDSDGMFRGVIAHADPGVPNWLDTAGHERGTLIARFVLAEQSPRVGSRSVKLASLPGELPADTPRIEPTQREASLARRRRAVWRRFRV
ncbi:MAG: DUF1214 domain-containing protein [Myxococcota bacterium]